jgi:choline dehydrogenase-like flavoprotein
MKYDVISIGVGSGDGVLAAQLSSEPKRSVLRREADSDDPSSSTFNRTTRHCHTLSVTRSYLSCSMQRSMDHE